MSIASLLTSAPVCTWTDVRVHSLDAKALDVEDIVVSGDASVGGNLLVSGTSHLVGQVNTDGKIVAAGAVSGTTLSASANIVGGASFILTGAADMKSTVRARGVLTTDVAADIGTDLSVGGILSVTGVAGITGALSAASLTTALISCTGLDSGSGDLKTTGEVKTGTILASGASDLKGLVTCEAGVDAKATRIITTGEVISGVNHNTTRNALFTSATTNVDSSAGGTAVITAAALCNNIFYYSSAPVAGVTLALPSATAMATFLGTLGLTVAAGSAFEFGISNGSAASAMLLDSSAGGYTEIYADGISPNAVAFGFTRRYRIEFLSSTTANLTYI